MKQHLAKVLLTVGVMATSPLMAASAPQPSYESLVYAKQLCVGMSMRVKALISQAQSPGDSRPGLLSESQDSGSEEVLENDTAALFALQGMGRGTFALGQSLDQALAHYGAPDFYIYHRNVCVKTHFLAKANLGSRIAAALPSVGVITPDEFDQFEVEIGQVKAQALCY